MLLSKSLLLVALMFSPEYCQGISDTVLLPKTVLFTADIPSIQRKLGRCPFRIVGVSIQIIQYTQRPRETHDCRNYFHSKAYLSIFFHSKVRRRFGRYAKTA